MKEEDIKQDLVVVHFKRQYANVSTDPNTYLYRIIGKGEHTETGEKFVVYEALYGTKKLWVRPMSQFLSEVDKTKYPDAKQHCRFEVWKK
jgi:hypothetical protein